MLWEIYFSHTYQKQPEIPPNPQIPPHRCTDANRCHWNRTQLQETIVVRAPVILSEKRVLIPDWSFDQGICNKVQRISQKNTIRSS